MAGKTTLQVMRCPQCGGPLKTDNPNAAIECLYCGNMVVPVSEGGNAPKEASADVLKVEGIKTPSSALAHIEILFEEYDWEEFYYSHNMTIPQAESVVKYMRDIAADSKTTWLASAMVCVVPFLKKAEGCNNLLADMAEAYEEEDMDAYALFDTYNRVSHALLDRLKTVTEELKRYQDYAKKYGAEAEDLAVFDNYLVQLQVAGKIKTYKTLEEVPLVAERIQQKNKQVVEELAATGVNVNEVYAHASGMLGSQNYLNALNMFRVIENYGNVKETIKEIDKYFLLKDTLKICNRLFYFVEQKKEGLALHAVENKIASARPLIKNIGQVITNYADTLYYLDIDNKLRRFNFATGMGELLGKVHFRTDAFWNDRNCSKKCSFLRRNWQIYMMSGNSLYELDLASGGLTVLLNNVVGYPFMEEQYIIYSYQDARGRARNVFDLDTKAFTVLQYEDSIIHGFADNYVFYSISTPSSGNRTLFRQKLGENTATLLEKNIFDFSTIKGDKLFYYVGSQSNRCLISTNTDGTNRIEWMRNISDILFKKGGWLYFIRRSGYNSLLCRSRLDGSRYKIISSNINEFVEIKDGYLYYLTYDNDLVKVRMDGTNQQTLRSDVQDVLCVKNDQIVFSSVDQINSHSLMDGSIRKSVVLSLYSVDFTGSGIRKLVYDIKCAKLYNEDIIYYIAEERRMVSPNDEYPTTVSALYRYVLSSGQIFHLMDLRQEVQKKLPFGIFIFLLVLGILAIVAYNLTYTPMLDLIGIIFACGGSVGIIACAVATILRNLKK